MPLNADLEGSEPVLVVKPPVMASTPPPKAGLNHESNIFVERIRASRFLHESSSKAPESDKEGVNSPTLSMKRKMKGKTYERKKKKAREHPVVHQSPSPSDGCIVAPENAVPGIPGGSSVPGPSRTNHIDLEETLQELLPSVRALEKERQSLKAVIVAKDEIIRQLKETAKKQEETMEEHENKVNRRFMAKDGECEGLKAKVASLEKKLKFQKETSERHFEEQLKLMQHQQSENY